MHALSSQIVTGSPGFFFSCSTAYSLSFSCFAPPASCHEWLINAATSPSSAGSVFALNWLFVLLSASASTVSDATGSARKVRFASLSAATAPPSCPPRIEATAAASCCLLSLLPSWPSHLWTAPRVDGVKAAAVRKAIAAETRRPQLIGSSRKVERRLSRMAGPSGNTSRRQPKPKMSSRRAVHSRRS